MELFYMEEHTSCSNYVTNNKSGFKLVTHSVGDIFTAKDAENNNIVFVMEGRIELSYDDYIDRTFEKGSVVFIPQSSSIFGKAISDCKLIILIFSSRVSSLCDKHTLNQYAESCGQVNFDFRGITVREPLTYFLELLEMYLAAGVGCAHLHEIKQKELFIIFRTAYTKQEMAEFFYPILGEDMDFKSKVLARHKQGYNIKEFSSILAMHERSFTSKFKRTFGTSYHQWTLKQKAKHIKHKLTYQKTTIKDIMKEFEFTDFSHFNRFCKDQFGCNPTEFITQIRGRESAE